MDTTKYFRLTLPLPPSVNKAFTKSSKTGWLVHTNEYSSYLVSAAWQVKKFCKENGIAPITQYTPLYLFFNLRRNGADSHNYKKCLFDAIEDGGLFKNDKWILDRTMEVNIDPFNPRIDLLISKEVGKAQVDS